MSLCEAVRSGYSIETIMAIVHARPESLQETFKSGFVRGYTPLHVAIAYARNPDVIRFLADADPGALEVEGYYSTNRCPVLPLHLALST